MTWGSRVLAACVLVLAVSNLAAAQQRIARYRELPNGPLQFVYEQFGVTPDKWQEQALRAFGDPKIQRISLQACAGPGKSAVLTWCGWYFLSTQCTLGEHPKGLATSVTGQNLKDNLWAEFSKWQVRSEYLSRAFTHSPSRIYANDHAETWFLSPRNWPKTGSPEEQGKTLSGLHSQNVLILVDESGAIPPTVLRAGEQALGNTTFGKILQAGNPISLEGMLYEAATRLRHLWHVIKITGDPDDPNRSPRIDLEWARTQIATYGRDNEWLKSYLLGEFPSQSLNALLGVAEVEAAMTRHLQPDDYNWSQKRLGIDVARFGDDRSVIFARQGLNARVTKNNPIVMRSFRTTDIAARAMRAIAKWGSEVQLVDDTGHWGHGVIDNLYAAGVNAIGVNFAGKPMNARYKNRRAEMWITMAEWVKRGGALPNAPELVAELTTPTYTFANGVFQLEEKDQIKLRLGRSPDLADALALTFALPDMPNGVLERLGRDSGKAITEYDPYAEAA